MPGGCPGRERRWCPSPGFCCLPVACPPTLVPPCLTLCPEHGHASVPRAACRLVWPREALQSSAPLAVLSRTRTSPGCRALKQAGLALSSLPAWTGPAGVGGQRDYEAAPARLPARGSPPAGASALSSCFILSSSSALCPPSHYISYSFFFFSSLNPFLYASSTSSLSLHLIQTCSSSLPTGLALLIPSSPSSP